MTKTEMVEYVSDMARQLAALCRETLPMVARLFELAADLAKESVPRARR